LVGEFDREEVSMGQLRRRRFLIASSALLAAPLVAGGQKGERVYRVGLLIPTAGRGPLEDIREKRFADLGWIKGRNISFIYRYSKVNDRLPALAKELAQEKVDVIMAVGTPAALAAKQATAAIPVVFHEVGDPVGVGLVSSLSRPGGNVTGISSLTFELGAKRLKLLTETLPEARRIGVLMNRTDPTASQVLEALRAGLTSGDVTVEPYYAGRPAEIETAFQSMKRHHVDGAMVQPDGMFWAQRARIVKLASELRLPTVYPHKQDVEAGGLMSYGASFLAMQAQAIAYVDKILKGAKPGDLPIQRAAEFELYINRKSAEALGLTIPQSLLLQADKVIE
jgi:ABC-type uncharacterized transport system substrate-binding protein